mmetsp:Transcript_8400/g.28791  ORF Transcript_8400/g.28791 Transcript_8400/m.28791 type:complete len:108 (-) Transcript_8400:416-739(-)
MRHDGHLALQRVLWRQLEPPQKGTSPHINRGSQPQGVQRYNHSQQFLVGNEITDRFDHNRFVSPQSHRGRRPSADPVAFQAMRLGILVARYGISLCNHQVHERRVAF